MKKQISINIIAENCYIWLVNKLVVNYRCRGRLCIAVRAILLPK